MTVDELLVLALALDIAPVNLLAGTDDLAPYPITPAVSVRTVVARRWMRGWPQSHGLPGITNQNRYLDTTPDSEDDVEHLTRGEYDRAATSWNLKREHVSIKKLPDGRYEWRHRSTAST